MNRHLLPHVLVALTAVAMLASGCFGAKEQSPPQGDEPPSTPSPTATRSTKPPPVAPLNASVPSRIAWNNCQGFDSTIFFYDNVVDLDDGQTPPGWEPGPTQDDRYFVQVNRY